MDIEREIDRRIQLCGIRLSSGQDDLRARYRRQIEMEKAWRDDMPERPIPTFTIRF